MELTETASEEFVLLLLAIRDSHFTVYPLCFCIFVYVEINLEQQRNDALIQIQLRLFVVCRALVRKAYRRKLMRQVVPERVHLVYVKPDIIICVAVSDGCPWLIRTFPLTISVRIVNELKMTVPFLGGVDYSELGTSHLSSDVAQSLEEKLRRSH